LKEGDFGLSGNSFSTWKNMKGVHPYLNFPGNAEEAFDFYRSVFGTELVDVVRYRDFADNPMGIAEEDLDKLAHIALRLDENHLLMATDVVPSMPFTLTIGNNYYVMLEAESGEEAERLFAALAEGGEIEMALQKTDWAEKYGHFADRFGVRWMIIYTVEGDRPGQ
jgi:PhnB protein